MRLYGVVNGQVRHMPSQVRQAVDGSPLEARLDQLRRNYDPALRRLIIGDFRNLPAGRQNPAQQRSSALVIDDRVPRDILAGNYFLATGVIGGSYVADAMSNWWMGGAKEIFHNGSYCLFGMGLALGAYTILNHFKKGSR